jgi:hypothetical protein
MEPSNIYYALDFAIEAVHESEEMYLRYADFHLGLAAEMKW